MPDLFGLNIAKLVNDGIKGAGGVRSGTLTRSAAGTRTGGQLTAGTNPTDSTFTFNGFAERMESLRKDSRVPEADAYVYILGASISTTPAVNDVALIDGVSYILLKLAESDPAAALYKFYAKSS